MQNNQIQSFLMRNTYAILSIIFGLIALLFPSITIATLAVIFSISVLIGSITLIINATRNRKFNRYWNIQIIEGLLGVLLSVIILSNIQLAAAGLIVLIGFWAIISGILLLASYYKLKEPGFERNFLLVSGIISILFGIVISLNPFEGARVIVVIIGIYSILYGVFAIAKSK